VLNDKEVNILAHRGKLTDMPFVREVAGYTAMDSKTSNALQKNWNEHINAEICKGWKNT